LSEVGTGYGVDPDAFPGWIVDVGHERAAAEAKLNLPTASLGVSDGRPQEQRARLMFFDLDYEIARRHGSISPSSLTMNPLRFSMDTSLSLQPKRIPLPVSM
jgi:hypothetical protein